MISLDTQQWLWSMNGDRMFPFTAFKGMVYLPFINWLERNYPQRPIEARSLPQMNPYETCLPSAQADVCYYRMWNIP